MEVVVVVVMVVLVEGELAALYKTRGLAHFPFKVHSVSILLFGVCTEISPNVVTACQNIKQGVLIHLINRPNGRTCLRGYFPRHVRHE